MVRVIGSAFSAQRSGETDTMSLRLGILSFSCVARPAAITKHFMKAFHSCSLQPTSGSSLQRFRSGRSPYILLEVKDGYLA